jgi:ABC-type nitrate/sulfonate/bicarbonate transport system permease component
MNARRAQALSQDHFAERTSMLLGHFVTLRIALQAFFAAIVIGTLIAFLFGQSRAIEMSFFPTRFCCK